MSGQNNYNTIYGLVAVGEDYDGAFAIGLAGYFIEENNHLIFPDAVIDPNAYYETYQIISGSPTFRMTKPT